MNKIVILFSEEQSTMVSSWTPEIRCRPTRGGGCILETHICSPDASDEDDPLFDFDSDRYFCSDTIKTEDDFVAAWKECCDVLSLDAEIDDGVISKLGTICPLVAKQLRTE